MKKNALRRLAAMFMTLALLLTMGCNVNININDKGDKAVPADEETAEKNGSENGDESAGAQPSIDTSVMKPWINSNILGLVTDDVTADIKDDYYLNVNHDYLRDTKLRPGRAGEAPFYEALEIVRERCFDILNDESLTGRDAQMIQDYYRMYLDWDARNEAGVEPLRPFIEELKAVDDIDGMTEYLLSDDCYRLGVDFVQFNIGSSADDSSLYELKVLPSTLTLGDPAEYSELTEDGKRKKEYNDGVYSYMLGRFGFSEDETGCILNDLYDFEGKLAGYEMTALEKRDPDALKKRINPVTMDDLRKMSPDFPCAEYFEKWGFGDSKLINLAEPEWLKGLNGLYNEDNLDGLRAYLLTRTLSTYISCLDEEAYRKKQELDNAYRGIKESKPDEENAYEETRKMFPNSMARIYVDRYITKEMRDEIRQLCQDAADTYKEMLDDTEWLSDETKEQAKYKLEHITINAMYPDKWEDDTMFFVTPAKDGGSYFEAKLDHDESIMKRELSHVNGKVDKDIWGVDILETNAFYSQQKNSINIIAGFMCDATYSSDMTIEEKYGALGSVIGHEISHAFDTNGAQYDADGNVKDWWSRDDYNAFRERAGKLVDYYDKVVAFDEGTPYHGQMVQTEAIADMAGI
ncbi:MAG: M13 family metallopeptidase, partial [Lachnospiraceae bacterium]|nr:M13 family metallopeptidase [Lachnospiraceae bacterium]